MKEKSFSMWEGKENWFKYEKTFGLRDFPEAMPLGFTATKIALRSLKYHLEDFLQHHRAVDLIGRFRENGADQPILLGKIFQNFLVFLHKVGAA